MRITGLTRQGVTAQTLQLAGDLLQQDHVVAVVLGHHASSDLRKSDTGQKTGGLSVSKCPGAQGAADSGVSSLGHEGAADATAQGTAQTHQPVHVPGVVCQRQLR